MPVQISYEKENDLLIVTVDGEISPQEYLETLQSIVESEEINTEANAIWDLRNMAFHHIDMNFQNQIIEVRKQFASQRSSAKIALVSDYDLAEPILKVFEILSLDNAFKQHQVFRDLAQAREWILAADS